MGTVNIKEAEADLSRLVPASNEPRNPGYLKGQIHMAEDFDASLPDDILKAFLGEGE